MKNWNLLIGLFSVCLVLGTLAAAPAAQFATSVVAVGGYDAVAYQTEGKAVRGSGDHLAVYNGETYLFSSEANKKKFEADPARFAPAFGGYCAYGVAVGKKFYGDPEVWKVVDGTLYLNLNPDVQKLWNKDIPGHIRKAEGNWPKIQDKAPWEL